MWDFGLTDIDFEYGSIDTVAIRSLYFVLLKSRVYCRIDKRKSVKISGGRGLTFQTSTLATGEGVFALTRLKSKTLGGGGVYPVDII